MAVDTGTEKVIVVTGAYPAELNLKENHSSVVFLQNDEWEEGMASSIRNGLKELLPRLNGRLTWSVVMSLRPSEPNPLNSTLKLRSNACRTPEKKLWTYGVLRFD